MHVRSAATRLKVSSTSGKGLSISDGPTVLLDSRTVPDAISAAGAPFVESTEMGKAEAPNNRQPSPFVRSASADRRRRFTVPLFTAVGVSDRTLLLHEIGHGDHVRVYASARNNSAAEVSSCRR